MQVAEAFTFEVEGEKIHALSEVAKLGKKERTIETGEWRKKGRKEKGNKKTGKEGNERKKHAFFRFCFPMFFFFVVFQNQTEILLYVFIFFSFKDTMLTVIDSHNFWRDMKSIQKLKERGESGMTFFSFFLLVF